MPDEATIRKLVRRLGAEVIEGICAQVTAEASSSRAGARRFVVRAARIDCAVVEADIRYPTDLGFAEDAVRALAREGAKARGLAGGGAAKQAAAKFRVGARTWAAWPILAYNLDTLALRTA